MGKKDLIVREATVVESLPGAEFRVQLDAEGDNEGETIIAYLGGKMRRYRISTLPGDRVKVQLDPKYPEIGRIVYRSK